MRRVIILLGSFAWLTMSTALAPMSAATQPDGPSCTIGEANSNFQAPFEHFVKDDLAVRWDCSYRLFFHDRSFTYCEGDVVLAGNNVFDAYQQLGFSRAESMAYLETVTDRVWIDGVEQTLVRTVYKDGMHPVYGKVLYQHRALFLRLEPGTHTSVLEETWDGVTQTYTVYLEILPASDPSCS